MARNGGNEGEEISQLESGSGSQTQGEPVPKPIKIRNKADPLLIVCRGFSVITALTAILCIAVNVLSAVRSFKSGGDIFDGIFRCYAVAITIFVVLAETEWGFLFKFWRILEYWVGRGMLQIFVAVMTRAFPDDGNRNLTLLQDISSYLLLACGVIYVIAGLLCIGFLKRARQNEETTTEQAFKDLKDLERRREELEALLITERD